MLMRNIFKPKIFLQDRILNTFAKFDRGKTHINVGTIGHIDHGKTTLTSAITKYLATKNKAQYVEYAKIDKAPEEKARGITINTATLEYQTDTRHYAHVDCPGHIDYVKNMITGAAKMDAGILVVAATDGPMPQTKEHVLLCRQIGVDNIIVFLNKMDLVKEEEVVDLIEQQLKELLVKHQYDPSKAVFVRGSALAYIQDTNPELGEKKIQELLKAMDEQIPIPQRAIDKPFMMSIQNTYNIAGRGAVASGTIQQGKCKIGDEVEFIGYGKRLRTTVTGIQTFNKTLDYGQAGDNVGILVRGLTREQIHRGLVMAKPSTLSVHSVLEANIYCLKESEGGRKNSFSTGYRPQLYFKTADTAAEIKLPEGTKIVMPGDNVKIQAKLNFPITITKGSRFALREGGKTIAAGVVTEILPQDTQLDFGKVKRGQKPLDPQAPATGETQAKTQPPKTDPKGKDSKAQTQDKGKQQPTKDAGKPQPAKDAGKDAGKDTGKDAGKGQPAQKTQSPAPKQGDKPGQPQSPPKAAGKTPPPAPPASSGKTPPPPPPASSGKTPPPPPPPKGGSGKVPPPPPPKTKTPPPPPPKKK